MLEGKLGEKKQGRVENRGTDGAQYYADQWREKVMIKGEKSGPLLVLCMVAHPMTVYC